MDDDSDTAFNNLKNTDVGLSETLINANESKKTFKQLVLTVLFTLLTVVTAFIPGLSDVLDISLKSFFTLGAVIMGYQVYHKAAKDICKKRITTDVMLTFCTFVSFLFAIFTGLHMFNNAIIINSDFYFVVTVINLCGMLFGNYVKSKLGKRSGDAVAKLRDFIPKKVEIVREGIVETVDFKSIQPNDIAKIMPGEKIPFDGLVVEGITKVDESALTGKNIPVNKTVGNTVYAGSINKYGEIVIKCLYNPEENLVSRIIKSAQKEFEGSFKRKNITERTTEKYFAFVFVISLAIGILFKVLHFAPIDALMFSVMTFILACPMSFAFTEPLLLACVISKAGKDDIVFKNPEVVAFLNDSDIFAFDKEGTLTNGEHTITDFCILGDFSEKEILEYAASIESVTDHPICDAIFDYAFLQGVSPVKPESVVMLDDGVIKAVVSGKEVALGESLIFDDVVDKYINLYNKLKKEGKTVAFISVDSKPAAIIAAKDSYRVGAVEFMKFLSDNGIEIHCLADADSNAENFPDTRAKIIKSLKSKGKTVVMIGDGVNDTLAFLSSDIAITVGNANDTALEAADVVIESNDFSDIVKAINIGNAYKKIAWQNIAAAITVSFILLGGAFASVLSGLNFLGLEVILADLICVLTVLINTRRIVRDK